MLKVLKNNHKSRKRKSGCLDMDALSKNALDEWLDNMKPKIEIKLFEEDCHNDLFKDFGMQLRLKEYFTHNFLFSVELDLNEQNGIYFHLLNDGDTSTIEYTIQYTLLEICQIMNELDGDECEFPVIFAINGGELEVFAKTYQGNLGLSCIDKESLGVFKNEWKNIFEWIINQFS